MKFRYLQNGPKKRRGLSSLVGALLFVVLMVATFTTLGQALDSQTDLVNVAREVSDKGLKKQQEDFDVSLSTDEFLTLDVTVVNGGPNAVEIFSMIITNGTNATAGYPTKVYDIPNETSFIAPGKSSNILSTTNMTMALNNNYEIKVISALGTIKMGTMICDDSDCGFSGYSSLEADLFMDPPFGIPTKNVTAVLNVKNVGRVPLTDVKPSFQIPDTSWIVHSPSSSMIGPSFDSSAPVTLNPQESAIFKWDLIVDGTVGDVWNFTNAANGTDPTLNVVTSLNSTDQIVLIDPTDCGGCEEGEGESLILLEDLLIKPGIFLTIPSPFGTTGAAAGFEDDLGVWSVNIANPTNSTIEVNKVTITAFAPGANSNVLIFDPSGNTENILPPGGGIGDWAIASENVMLWRNNTMATLGPFEVQSFGVKVKPEHNTLDLESVLIQSSVFSNFGSFGKTGYQTTMFSTGGADNAPIVNVYNSNVKDSKDSADMSFSILDVVNGTSQLFKIILADMDDSNTTYIESGAELIVNVPREWNVTDIDLTSSSNFGSYSTFTHGDGTTQIIAITDDRLGDSGPDTATLFFNATSPNKKDDRMSVMYLLANGKTDDGNSVGPLSEMVLHTIGTG